MAGEPLLGEERIIQEFLAPLAVGYADAFGLRDDCALLRCRPGHVLVVKTDGVAAGVHFLAEDRPEDIGWKALAVNVSDLAAKGASPVAYVLSLAFPAAPTRDWMAGFAAGLGEAQSAFGMHLIGGDTDRRPGPLAITPCVFGEVPDGRMVRRGTARAGDFAYVSGTLGDAALGLAVRRGEAHVAGWRLSAGAREHLLGRYLRPQPRLGLSTALLAHASAAMDISDGLAKDLGRMCRASGVGASIEVASLPLSAATRAALTAVPTAIEAVLAGDDYEVLAAVPAQSAPAYEAAAAAGGVPVTRVGRFDASGAVRLLDADGRPLALSQAGYDHF